MGVDVALVAESGDKLEQVRIKLGNILGEVEATFDQMKTSNLEKLCPLDADLRNYVAQLNERQLPRIKDITSKTRLSILYYAIVGNAMMLSKQNLKLLEIFENSFGEFEDLVDSSRK